MTQSDDVGLLERFIGNYIHSTEELPILLLSRSTVGFQREGGLLAHARMCAEEVCLNRSVAVLAVATLMNLHLGCGGEDPPAAPAAVTTPPPAPAATAAPTATATPSGLCANGNMPVARFDIKVYAVREKDGDLREFHPRGPFFVGESLRFDSQGKDRFGRRTDGCTGEGPRWSWGPDEVVEWNGLYGWMPSAVVLKSGTLRVTAEFEGGALDYPLELRLE